VTVLKCDVVLVNYVFLSGVLEGLPPHVHRVIDTHDRMSGRLELYRDIGATPGFFYTTVEQERLALGRADTVIAIQDIEAAYFRQQGAACVEVIGHLPPKREASKAPSERLRVGFLGSANKFNVASLAALLEEMQHRDTPRLELVIGGGVCGRVESCSAGVTQLGFVEDPVDFYKQVDVVIVPLLVGTGLKIKTVEALAFGKPVVSTRVGFEGLRAEHAYHQCGDLAALMDALQGIEQDPGELHALTAASARTFEMLQAATTATLDRLFPAADNSKLSATEMAREGKIMELWQRQAQTDFLHARGRAPVRKVLGMLDELIRIPFLHRPLAKYAKYRELARLYQKTQNDA